jgi:regulator of replication initiation timing
MRRIIMTENLLQKLEEKMMMLLSEIESLRVEVVSVKRDNAALRIERERAEERLRGIISLLDSVSMLDAPVSQPGMSMAKPVLVQG